MNIDKCELPKLDFPTKEENKLCNYEKYSKHAQSYHDDKCCIIGAVN
jgi:hypothetical protein